MNFNPFVFIVNILRKNILHWLPIGRFHPFLFEHVQVLAVSTPSHQWNIDVDPKDDATPFEWFPKQLLEHLITFHQRFYRQMKMAKVNMERNAIGGHWGVLSWLSPKSSYQEFFRYSFQRRSCAQLGWYLPICLEGKASSLVCKGTI